MLWRLPDIILEILERATPGRTWAGLHHDSFTRYSLIWQVESGVKKGKASSP
jgi:hypothetical protein